MSQFKPVISYSTGIERNYRPIGRYANAQIHKCTSARVKIGKEEGTQLYAVTPTPRLQTPPTPKSLAPSWKGFRGFVVNGQDSGKRSNTNAAVAARPAAATPTLQSAPRTMHANNAGYGIPRRTCRHGTIENTNNNSSSSSNNTTTLAPYQAGTYGRSAITTPTFAAGPAPYRKRPPCCTPKKRSP